jgi:hypothetical protein
MGERPQFFKEVLRLVEVMLPLLHGPWETLQAASIRHQHISALLAPYNPYGSFAWCNGAVNVLWMGLIRLDCSFLV